MNTKTTAALWGVAAVALIGGGTAYALNQPVETPAAVSTETPAPEATVEPTPSAEPTPETTTPVATPTPTPEQTYTEGEEMLIHVTQVGDLANLALTNDEIMAFADSACDVGSSAEFAASSPIPSATAEQTEQFWINATSHVCHER